MFPKLISYIKRFIIKLFNTKSSNNLSYVKFIFDTEKGIIIECDSPETLRGFYIANRSGYIQPHVEKYLDPKFRRNQITDDTEIMLNYPASKFYPSGDNQ